MKVGWMWFDDEPGRTLEEKVERAAQKYKEKFGHKPTLCYVNAACLGRDKLKLNGIQIIAARNILPHHFWLGVEAPASRKLNSEQETSAQLSSAQFDKQHIQS